MMDLGLHEGERPVLLREIAREEKISEKYLGQIIIPLKSHGLVVTRRGARGGYILGRPSAEIRIGEIVEALEGDMGLSESPSGRVEGEGTGTLIERDFWEGLGRAMRTYLDSRTLCDLVIRLRSIRGDPVNDAHYSI
jgi:Rrf2 family protein